MAWWWARLDAVELAVLSSTRQKPVPRQQRHQLAQRSVQLRVASLGAQQEVVGMRRAPKGCASEPQLSSAAHLRCAGLDERGQRL